MAFVRKTDIVIVGAGVMGAATAHALRRSGRDVVVLERFALGHINGSSHGRSRIFRLSYPDANYVDMAKKSLRLWRELEREMGESLLTTLGGLDVGDGLDRHASAMSDCSVEFERLEGRTLARRLNSVSVEPSVPVLYQRDAGILVADLAVRSFLRSAAAHRTDIHEGERVISLDVLADGVKVRTDSAVYDAGAVVVTAGGWATSLLADIGIDLPVRVTQETVAYFHVNGEPPPPIVDWGEPSTYALPSPGEGIKAGQHIAGPEVDPDSPAVKDARSVEVVSTWVQRRFPTADNIPHRIETCLYTNTDDQRFILERHGPVIVGSACSGHGFKFAPLIGERLARLAEGLTL